MKRIILLLLCITVCMGAACSGPKVTAPVTVSVPPSMSAQATEKPSPAATKAPVSQGETLSPSKTAEITPQVLEFSKWEEDIPETLKQDIDGDGKEEAISLEKMASEDTPDYSYLKVTDDDGKEYTESIETEEAIEGGAVQALAMGDLNPTDSFKEIFVTIDRQSADDETFCFRFDGEKLQKAHAPGAIESLENGNIVLRNTVNVFGSWQGLLPYQITDEFQMEPVEGALWQVVQADTEHPFSLTVKKDFTCEEIKDGMTEKITVSKGTSLRLTATDQAFSRPMWKQRTDVI